MKTETLKTLALAGWLLVSNAGSLQAQSLSLQSYVISGGGGASSNASQTLVGTIGQWGTGTMTGGDLTVKTGLWSSVTNSPSSGVLLSSTNPALPGTAVTFTETVSASELDSGTPSGTVNFRIDGNIAGSGELSGGVATFTTSTLAHGSHTVVAEYAGDPNFIGVTNSLSPNQIINTPPVAGNVTLARNPVSGTKVLLSILLASSADADGDALTLTVSPTSTNNVPIVVGGGWVFYTPPNGFTGADSFTYTVADGFGGSATGTINVTVPVDNCLSQNLVITPLGNNQFLINGSGIAGYTYQLQYSDTILPYTWQTFAGGSLTADSTGKFQYTDTTQGQTRYYRTVYP